MAERHSTSLPPPRPPPRRQAKESGNDDVYDISTPGTLQRGTSMVPTSPKEQQGNAATRFLRRSFKSGKDKYTQIYHEFQTDLGLSATSGKDKYKQLKLERDYLLKEREQLYRRLAAITSNNDYHISSLQLGDNNTVINTVDMGAIDKAVEEIEDMASELTGAVDRILEEKSDLELQLDNHKVMLMEIQEMMSALSKTFEENSKNENTHFSEIKDILSKLQSDRSDDELMQECIEGLKEHINTRPSMIADYTSLPENVRPGVTRLVNKFRNMKWQDFATNIGLNPSSIEQPGEDGKLPDTHNEDTTKTPLDKNTCAHIMAEWVKDPEHDFDMFMNHLKNIDSEKSKEAKKAFTKSVIDQRKQTVASRRNPPQSGDSSSTDNERIRNEQRTQTAHAVVLYKKLLDTVKPLKTKMDDLDGMKAQIEALYVKEYPTKSGDSSSTDNERMRSEQRTQTADAVVLYKKLLDTVKPLTTKMDDLDGMKAQIEAMYVRVMKKDGVDNLL